MRRRSSSSVVVLAALVAAGCVGLVEPPGEIPPGSTAGLDPRGEAGGGRAPAVEPAGPGGASAGAGAPEPSAAPFVVDPAPTACPPGQVGPLERARARRLSHAEYRATVRDLFAGVALPPITLVEDPKADGFENRSRLLTFSALLFEQYQTAARALAAAAVRKKEAIVPCAAADAGCPSAFVESFGLRAFRRPLTAAEKGSYLQFFEAQKSALGFDGALDLTLRAFLLSPHFLVRAESGDRATLAGGRMRLRAFEIASRLSYLLWGTMPDRDLLEAARTGALATEAAVATAARRMLKDPRARESLIGFHRQWLAWDALDQAEKDPKLFPAFERLRPSIAEESRRFVGAVMFDGDGSLPSLLGSAETWVDAPLAGLYGVAPPPSGWGRVTLREREHAGLLTRAHFLAPRAHDHSPSPILRGLFVYQRLLCQKAPPPPPDVDTTPPEKPPGRGVETNRALYQQKTAGALCSACHARFDPLGYAFETYDAMGKYRSTENGLPVDASGALAGTDVDGAFSDGVDLSRSLARSAMASRCMTKQWLEFASGREATAADACRIERLAGALAAGRGDLREMLVSLAASPEFLHLAVP